MAWAEAMLAARTTQSSSWLGRTLTLLISLVAPAAVGGGSYADNFGVQWIAKKIVQANRPQESK